MGVDVGVRTAAVVATAAGTLVATLEASRALRDALAHIKHLQRALSRTQKGSANRAKARLRLGRAHARVGAVRTSRLHQFTAKLATSHGVVVVEDIATANLMRNHHLAQAIGDQGWGQLASLATRPPGPAPPWWSPTGGCPQARRARAVVQPNPRCPWPCAATAATSAPWSSTGTPAPPQTSPPGARSNGLTASTSPAAGSRAGDRHPGGRSAQLAEHACAGSSEPASTAAGALVEAGTSRPRTRVA